MRWEDLTADDFTKAVKKSRGVCLLAVSCLERHGGHLPLGTDLFWGKTLAERAAALEPVVVFPPYYFGQINCGRSFPGTVALKHDLLFNLLEEVCNEIARNGLKKIVLLNAHGGNEFFLPYFAQIMLERERDYAVHVIRLGDKSVFASPEWQKLRETEVDGHGGEVETSRMLVARPDLVRMKALTPPGLPRGRLRHLPANFTGIWWYADFPDHYAGSGEAGSLKKGKFILDYEARKVAAILKAIKADRTTLQLQREFYARTEHDPVGLTRSRRARRG